MATGNGTHTAAAPARTDSPSSTTQVVTVESVMGHGGQPKKQRGPASEELALNRNELEDRQQNKQKLPLPVTGSAAPQRSKDSAAEDQGKTREPTTPMYGHMTNAAPTAVFTQNNSKPIINSITNTNGNAGRAGNSPPAPEVVGSGSVHASTQHGEEFKGGVSNSSSAEQLSSSAGLAGGSTTLRRNFSGEQLALQERQRISDRLFEVLKTDAAEGTIIENDGNQESIHMGKFFAELRKRGIFRDDPRMKGLVAATQKMEQKLLNRSTSATNRPSWLNQSSSGGSSPKCAAAVSRDSLTSAAQPLSNTSATHSNYLLTGVVMSKAIFVNATKDCVDLFEKVFFDDLVIPQFEDFAADLEDIFLECEEISAGELASYIPNLAKQNPKLFGTIAGMSCCTVDGQRAHFGDYSETFCLQSCVKPLTYCLALEEFGSEEVHKHMGREPSGDDFNALKLNREGLPHNPLINSGAIMTSSLVKPDLDMSSRFEYVNSMFAQMAAGKPLGFSNVVYLSEKDTADRNFALAYFMREKGGYPKNTNITQTLEFYFQQCSMTLDCDSLSVIAATLANGGVCPLTGVAVLHAETVRNCLSLMYSCGMYDYSGEFAFRVGLPAKSGVSGCVFVIVPNVMGIAIFSPLLDKYGNSVKGVEFCMQLTNRFNFHQFDSLLNYSTEKKDPRKNHERDSENEICDAIRFAAKGNVTGLKLMKMKGCDFGRCDYDMRTPLHLAASNGHLAAVKFLCRNLPRSAQLPVDRWGGTPISDAERGSYSEVVDFLERYLNVNRNLVQTYVQGATARKLSVGGASGLGVPLDEVTEEDEGLSGDEISD